MYTSLSNDITKSINFTETIGHGKSAPRCGRRDDSNCYWLKAEWKQNNDNIRQTLIIPYFVGAASHAGFRIHGCWDHTRQCIRFQCFRYKKNNSSYNIDYYQTKVRLPKKLKYSTSPPVERVRKTQRPSIFTLEEDLDQYSPEESNTTCKFAFRVHWASDLERWFIPQKQSGCKCHNGHPHVEHPLLRIQPRHAIPINEIGVAVSSVNSNIGPSLTSALIHNRTGVQLDWNQVDYIRRKKK